MRAQPPRIAAIGAGLVEAQIFRPPSNGLTTITADLQQFAVHVQQVAAAGPFVKVVDVLGDDKDAARPFGFQPG